MATRNVTFSCMECGAELPERSGRCDICAESYTVTECSTHLIGSSSVSLTDRKGKKFARDGLATSPQAPERSITNVADLDRFLGRGLVPTSAVLIGSGRV